MASRQQPPTSLLLLTLLLLGCSVAVTLVSSTSIAVPSYFYPCTGSSKCKWDMMDNNANAVKIAIINPDSGPGSSVDQAYASQVTRSKTAGISVVGYVHTSYGQRSISDVIAEVDKYYSWYQVDGIFFDEVSDSCSTSSYYTELYNHVHSYTSALVILNPGTNVPECFASFGDVIVVFESPYKTYKKYTPNSWYANYPSTRFWHIVYGVSSSKFSSVYRKAVSANAGYVYITDDKGANPYDTLPKYFSKEVAAVL